MYVRSNSSGFSLISILVSTGLLSVLAIGMSSLLGNAFHAGAKISNDLDREAVQGFLMNITSCTDTLPAGTCTPGSLIRLKRLHKNGTVSTVIPTSGTRYGKLTARAECSASGDSVILKAVHLKVGASIQSTSESDYNPDPLTGEIVMFSNAKAALLPAGVELCAATRSLQYGGFYTFNTGDVPGGFGCYSVNPVTGSCSCPAGYSVQDSPLNYSTAAQHNYAGNFNCTGYCTYHFAVCYR